MLKDSITQPDWHSEAACIGKWEMFDCEDIHDERNVNACKTICYMQCPVRQQCLHDAMMTEIPDVHSNNRDYGRSTIRGGLTPGERTKILGTLDHRNWTWEDTQQF